MKRLLLPILIAALMLFASTRPQQAPAPDVAEAQENAPYHMSSFVCPGPADCCAVPVPMMTQPVPGGTPTVLAESDIILYGAHVNNLNRLHQRREQFQSVRQRDGLHGLHEVPRRRHPRRHRGAASHHPDGESGEGLSGRPSDWDHAAPR